nr:transposase [Ventosimonas gracilis]
MVCIEDLQVRNMSKSAAGTSEAPGRNVKAKSGLNKAILDQGWFEFRRQLQYKLDWNGGMLIAVPPQNTSRTCPACGHVSKDNRRTQAHFACVECSYENNADIVGAINVLRAGHARFACEVNPDVGDQQQEPAEVIQPGKCLAGRGRNLTCLARGGCQLLPEFLQTFGGNRTARAQGLRK